MPRVNSPCLGCTERTADPNCHNPKICAKWADYSAKAEEEREKEKAYRSRYQDEARQVRERVEKMQKQRKWRKR